MKRPLTVTIVGVLFIIIGIGSLFKAVWPLLGGNAGRIAGHEFMDSGIVFVSAVVALVSGLFVLRGANWARWLCLLWMAFHVVVSIFHNTTELLVHLFWMLVLILLLMFGKAAVYFRTKA
ncbi:MAG TPA: hypothetical protein VI306_19100 [Pyrinomonadaceae bacterium]